MEKRKESKKEQEGQEGGEQPKCWKTFWMEVIVVIDDELEKQQQQQKQREDNIRKLIIDRKKRWESPTKASVVKNEESVGLFIEETTWQSP